MLNTVSSDNPMAVDFLINEAQLNHYEQLQHSKQHELDSLFKNRMALVVRPNDYKYDLTRDPPNDGRPIAAWCLGFWTEDPAKGRTRIEQLHHVRVPALFHYTIDEYALVSEQAVAGARVEAELHRAFERRESRVAGEPHLAEPAGAEQLHEPPPGFAWE